MNDPATPPPSAEPPAPAEETAKSALVVIGHQAVIKMPKMSKWTRCRIRDFEIVPGKFDGRYVYKGRPLDFDEFNKIAEKILGDDTLAHRLTVEIVPVYGEADAASEAPTVEDALAMLEEIDRLRAENKTLRTAVDGMGAAAVVEETRPDEPAPVESEQAAPLKPAKKKK